MEEMPSYTDRRNNRLKHEFERIQSVRRPNSLIKVYCADLSADEVSMYLGRATTRQEFNQIINDGLRGFLTPEQFVIKFPNQPPEKYLLVFNCVGLRQDATGNIVETTNHAMEVIFNVDYPVKPPRFVWLTPIWHPNIHAPFICNADLAFPISATLDQIAVMTARMVQYRHYNMDDPLAMTHNVVAWLKAQPESRFPVDSRDVLTGELPRTPLVMRRVGGFVEWVDGVPTESAAVMGDLIELIDNE
jgi:hypothetical protein